MSVGSRRHILESFSKEYDYEYEIRHTYEVRTDARNS